MAAAGSDGELLSSANGSDSVSMADNINNNHTGETYSYILPWWQQAFFYTIFVVIFVMAAGGNIIVIWIVLAHKRMRTVTNYFLVNLAVADVLISIFNVPFHLTFNMYQIWFFGLEYCKIDFFIAPFAISASVLTFMAIAIDR
ncbi:urechistachykinin receptor [Elysia marginata]|uniref:Urechistachykinin receptor n=1 Tax=Elysia marginata TaxID=1093978 RepID=A0AAV4JIL3_9GAST|nr:urechistachykinin receptor [Elysia marginata]